MKAGIDFGTTNSSISVKVGDKVEVLPIDNFAEDKRVLRSMIYFGLDGSHLVGQQAVNHYLDDNKNRQPGVKKKVYTGNMIEVGEGADLVEEYFEETDYGTGRLLQSLKSSLRTSFKGTRVFDKFYEVEDLIALFLKEIKQRAEEKLGEKITEVVSGRPVYFSEDPEVDKLSQQRLQEGFKRAGFANISFEFEPVAAAKSFLRADGKPQTVFVFDFGGGTLDTSIVKFENGKEEVLATDGVYIGGDLLNSDIMQFKLWDYFGASATWSDAGLPMPYHLYQDLMSWYIIPTLNSPDTLEVFDKVRYKNSDPAALDRFLYLIQRNLGFEIYHAIEQAKKELSSNETATITFEDGLIDIHIRISKAEFEEIIKPRVNEIREVVLRTLNKAKLDPSQVDQVVKTGGSSMIPVFSNMLEDIFNKEKVLTFETFTSIAAGLVSE